MGTSNVRLVKASAQPAPQPTDSKPKQVKFTNWSRQFMLEHEQEMASRLPARQQFDNLFQKEVN